MLWIQAIPAKPSRPPCPVCGVTLRELTSTGRVGCAGCYEHYADVLRPYIKRLGNGAGHVGSAPASAGAEISARRRLQNLEREMQKAIAEQAFERCAELRDEIAKLKGETGE